MAHCSCYYGHSMWNGDGKPVVWAFRLAFFEEFQREHPDIVLGSEEYYALFDCFEQNRQEDLDCWYCDECGSFVVFVGDAQYGMFFVPVLIEEPLTEDQLSDWELYLAMRDQEFDEFSDQYDGKRPMDALMEYPIPYRCRVSPEKAKICVFNGEGKMIHYFEPRFYPE